MCVCVHVYGVCGCDQWSLLGPHIILKACMLPSRSHLWVLYHDRHHLTLHARPLQAPVTVCSQVYFAIAALLCNLTFTGCAVNQGGSQQHSTLKREGTLEHCCKGTHLQQLGGDLQEVFHLLLLRAEVCALNDPVGLRAFYCFT